MNWLSYDTTIYCFDHPGKLNVARNVITWPVRSYAEVLYCRPSADSLRIRRRGALLGHRTEVTRRITRRITWGQCKTLTLDLGLDRGLDCGLDCGLSWDSWGLGHNQDTEQWIWLYRKTYEYTHKHKHTHESSGQVEVHRAAWLMSTIMHQGTEIPKTRRRCSISILLNSP